jgi:hypothetical protein
MTPFSGNKTSDIPAVSVPRDSLIGIYLPRDVLYCDGTSAILPEDYVLKEGNLRLFIPKNKIEEVINAMKTFGFHEDGEKHSLTTKFFYDIWDLRVRIYDDGFIDGSLEVSQKYRKYLYNYTVPSIYEVFEFYRTVYNNLYIFDNAANKWIKEVRIHYLVTLNSPSSSALPFQIIVGPLSMLGILAYPLSRLTCPSF